MEKALVVGLTHYSFTDESTKELKVGGTVQYLSPHVIDSTLDDKKVGMFPVTLKVKGSKFWNELKEKALPAMCEFVFIKLPNGKGGTVDTLVDVLYLHPINLLNNFKDSKPATA